MPQARLRFKLVNASFCSPGIPSLRRGNRDGPRAVQTAIRESDGQHRVLFILVRSLLETLTGLALSGSQSKSTQLLYGSQ